jgi:hypothetical protein
MWASVQNFNPAFRENKEVAYKSHRRRGGGGSVLGANRRRSTLLQSMGGGDDDDDALRPRFFVCGTLLLLHPLVSSDIFFSLF